MPKFHGFVFSGHDVYKLLSGIPMMTGHKLSQTVYYINKTRVHNETSIYNSNKQ